MPVLVIPECQPLLMRMKSDVVPVLQACARGELDLERLEWYDKAAVCIVMAQWRIPRQF